MTEKQKSYAIEIAPFTAPSIWQRCDMRFATLEEALKCRGKESPKAVRIVECAKPPNYRWADSWEGPYRREQRGAIRLDKGERP